MPVDRRRSVDDDVGEPRMCGQDSEPVHAEAPIVGYGAVRRFQHERIGRLARLGTLVGGVATAAGVLIAWLVDVLS